MFWDKTRACSLLHKDYIKVELWDESRAIRV